MGAVSGAAIGAAAVLALVADWAIALHDGPQTEATVIDAIGTDDGGGDRGS